MKKIILLLLTTIYPILAQNIEQEIRLDSSVAIKTPPAYPLLQLRADQLQIVYSSLNQLENPLYLSNNPLFSGIEENNGMVLIRNNRLSMSADFLSPSLQSYRNQQNKSAFTYVLGIMQGAAAGYLAYEHIRKYGFWDKKKEK